MLTDEEIPLGAGDFVQSELFARTFSEGMALVEETANYLDGEGRKLSKSLPQESALAYASASMRLTTLLMQIASWLLVLRAVREGEMAIAEASDNKYRLDGLSGQEPNQDADLLPERLTALVSATQQLYARIARLDRGLFQNSENMCREGDAAGQQRALLKAFGRPS